MAKLKKASIALHICPTCKGNGYIKVATEMGDTVHQCWDCDSEGEFVEYVTEDGNNTVDDGVSNELH